VHSDWSDDGSWPLPSLAAAFARRRYTAVLLAEHDRGWDHRRWQEYVQACREHSSQRCLLVPGIEYGDAANEVHVTVWGAPSFLGAGRPTVEILREARAAGAAAVLAHPGRRHAHERFTPEWASLLTAIEVWNRKYDGVAPNPHALALADRNPSLRRVVGNDFHTRRQFFPFDIVVDVEERSAEAVCTALANGAFRAHAFRADVGLLLSPASRAVLRAAESARLRVAVPLRRRRRRRARLSA
jgi:hypothetical protein